MDVFKMEKESDEESDENIKIDATDMPELETEQSPAERRNQRGHGLKILTPNQMLSGLPISSAHLNAGKNSSLKQPIKLLNR